MMQPMRAFMIGAVALVCSLSPVAAAVVSPPLGQNSSVAGNSSSLLQPVQYGRYDRDGYRDRRDRGYRDGRSYDRGYRGRDRDDGAAVAAGVLGFVLGTAIAGSANERTYARSRMRDRAWLDSCSRRYRSFDARSGTYMGLDGYRHYCS